MRVNIQEEIEKINHTRRLFDMLFKAEKIDQPTHRKMVTSCQQEIKLLTMVFTKHGKELNL